ncbi:hypothetical protein Xen7305DRAFT_00043180 [Xenococcus sp. PCC 7305]|uniref:hypothetical protein n=1 Tax=Xenococcus sp. PCC 7305 TaxID=102125 RepID=UPI0002AC10FA|nr:hypothetical protein [Xenococcus sp. PCC 7305]ELS04583.1 hypothetical protein Xen7305DRAFT_00043180 [Xenococcus sp. PCC 7305]
MNLEVKIIRMVWALVEKSNPYLILKLSDHELKEQLLQEIVRVFSLSPDDSKILSRYIGSRTVLIRDLADSKVD